MNGESFSAFEANICINTINGVYFTYGNQNPGHLKNQKPANLKLQKHYESVSIKHIFVCQGRIK